MEDNFDQNDFEQFLREQVKNHRMYPLDDVWQEINKKLHGEKKWPGLTIAGLTLLTITTAICVYFTPKPSIFAIKSAIEPIALSKPAAQTDNVLNRLASPTPFTKEPIETKNLGVLIPTRPQNLVSTGIETNSSNIAFTDKTTSEPNVEPAVDDKTSNEAYLDNNMENSAIAKQDIKPKILSLKNSANIQSPVENTLTTLSSSVITTAPNIVKRPKSETPKTEKDLNDKNMVDAFLKEHQEDIAIHTTPKGRSLKRKFSYQVYVAPSISYRKLVEDRSVLNGTDDNGPVGVNYVTDVNNVVRHKPGVGIEGGVAFLYHFSEKLRLKSGFQFNVRQYNIEAYRSNIELASIALVQNNRIDTVNSFAVYRNTNGNYQTELVNRYYQISVPLGIEWEVIGNSKIQFNVAASIQPTYLINKNAYILTTNFKNYTERPDIVRNWNVNSNIEAFVSFKSGNYKWQLGPQLRYQPYSTFIHQYPIKEHLMDYGIKVGISRIID